MLQSVRVDALNRTPLLLGELVNLPDARIISRVGEAYRHHTLRMLVQQHPDRMHSVNSLCVLQASSTRSRSMSPSIGFTDVTMTRICAPVRSRRPVRRPVHACPSSSITYSSSRRLSR